MYIRTYMHAYWRAQTQSEQPDPNHLLEYGTYVHTYSSTYHDERTF